MKINILTAVFYPEIHPRAFRAYELAKEFAAQGHKVQILLLTRVLDFDYISLEKELGVKVHLLDFYSTVLSNNTRQTFQSKNKVLQCLYGWYRFLLEYFVSGNLFFYSFRIAKELRTYCKTDSSDLFLALNTPFMNLYGTAIFHKRYAPNTSTIFVADSGDPFYYSQQTKRAFYFKWIERGVYKYFDYLSIPTTLAIPAYSKLIDEKKIKIIPQAFNMQDVNLSLEVNNSVMTFAYAGVFYRDIRNPEFLLNYLATIKNNFLFRIFLRHNDPMVEVILDKYKGILGDKLEVNYGLPREKLLYELSKCDFLINIGNLTTTQLPSKLIDYGITKRPIYSTVSSTFDPQILEKFMRRDYSSAMQIDIRPYDVKVVTKQFVELFVDKKGSK